MPRGVGTVITHQKGPLMATSDRSCPRRRFLTWRFCICLVVVVLICDEPVTGEDNGKVPLPGAHGRPFDEVWSQRIIAGAQREPVFIDIDTGRGMTAPATLMTQENNGKTVTDWAFSDALKHWIQHSGIDLAVQTDGHSIWLVGFDLRVGEPTIEQFKSEADVAKAVLPRRNNATQWITLRTKLANVAPGRTPFVTREGGLGALSLHITDFRGPNSIQVDYQLTRRPYVPKLTGQQVFAVYEPLILGQMATFLIADVTDHKLCLRTPGSSNQIEISADEVVVREAAHAELRAVRLHTGTLDIDAPAGRVTVNGRGKSATLRRVGDRIQVEFGKQIADSDEITIWMPELKIPDMRLRWKTAKADHEPKPR